MVKTKKDKKDLDFKYNLKLFITFVNMHKLLFFALISVVILKEFIRIGDKFLIKIVVDKGTAYTAGSITKTVLMNAFVIVAGVYIGLIIMDFLTSFFRNHFLSIFEASVMADLKRQFFNHIVHLSQKFHTTHKTGSLISRLTRGGSASERMIDVIVFNITPTVVQVLIVGGALLYFDWLSSLVALITFGIFIFYSTIILSIAKQANVEVNEAEDIEKGNIADIFMNIDSIKLFGKEGAMKKRFFKLSEITKLKLIKHWHFHRFLDGGQKVILGVGIFFLILFPLLRFLRGEIEIGTVVFIYTAFGGVTPHLYGFVHGIRNFYRSMVDFEALFQYNKITNDIVDKPNANKLRIRSGKIEFNDVTFAYHKKRLFKKFNLTIGKNQKVALVGHSGSGKSSLVKLLYRLYDVDGGEILIDGKNIADVKQESLRAELSIVPQECVLFDDTIYDNIIFSRPNATRKEVMAAMRFAQLHKIVSQFPNKEKTIVGERGVKLSGGEKQRVSIARALLADKKILVLDEATSALDSETEHEIQKDLEKLMKGRTSIIIAHRLSTIMKANKIVVLEKGKIVQMGTHKQLIRRKGQYRKLWNLQKGGHIK